MLNSVRSGESEQLKKAIISKRFAACMAASVGLAGSAQAGIVHTPGSFDTGTDGSINIDFDGINGPEFVIQHAQVKVALDPVDGELSILTDTDGSGQEYIGGVHDRSTSRGS